jgi:KinB signaling pathway activation protein
LTLRKWFHIFWTTMALGVVVAAVVGLILQANDKDFSFMVVGISGVGYNLVNMMIIGAMISVLSQMGFFAYLILRFIVAGIIKSKFIWDMLQLIIVAIVLFDLVYLRVVNFEGSILNYLVMPISLLVISLGVAYWKVKLTNQNGFIPTLFFMLAITVLEAVPAIKQDNFASSLFMLAPLVVCNAWQILILHKVLGSKKS